METTADLIPCSFKHHARRHSSLSLTVEPVLTTRMLLRNDTTNLVLMQKDGPPGDRLLGYKDDIAAEYFHIWGCPVYVLDSSLQTGTGIDPPKWDPCFRAGVYLGHSPHHDGNVALILNL
eukprot:11983970-Ditylum_brightwellii.AAC.1